VAADIQRALVYELKNDATIAALVGSQVYPAGGASKNATRPYITYQRIDRIPERHQEGSSSFPAARFQINCWADREKGAEEVCEAVKTLLESKSTGAGIGPADGQVTARGIFVEDDHDEFMGPDDATHRGPHRVIIDVLVRYRE